LFDSPLGVWQSKPQRPVSGETAGLMRERQRVEIVRDPLAAQGFPSIADFRSPIDPGTRATEAP